MSCLPVNYIHFALEAGNDDDHNDDDGKYTDYKALRLLRLFRLLRLLRLARVKRIMARYEEELHHWMEVLKLGKINIFVLFCCHWLACLWFWAGMEETVETDAGGNVLNGWVRQMYGDDGSSTVDGSYVLDFEDASNTSAVARYFASYYFAAMTLTTVGYGDITPTTTLERVINIVCMLVGGYVFGMVVGQVLAPWSRRALRHDPHIR